MITVCMIHAVFYQEYISLCFAIRRPDLCQLRDTLCVKPTIFKLFITECMNTFYPSNSIWKMFIFQTYVLMPKLMKNDSILDIILINCILNYLVQLYTKSL